MNRIRTTIAEPILADVISELTRMGLAVQEVTMAHGTCTLIAMAGDLEAAAFERWLAIFTEGASRLETIPE